MSAVVTIPADVAKHIADHLRNPGQTLRDREWADLLDPQPPSLREQVAETLFSREHTHEVDSYASMADAVLAVVADWLAAQPLALGTSHDPAECVRGAERDHDVRLLRGQS